MFDIRAPSDGDESYASLGLDERFALVPETGERVLGAFVGELRSPGLPALENTQLLVTDRRCTWINSNYDRGGGWAGFGAVGLAVATAANAASRARARKRSAGTAVAGQSRYEWVLGMKLRRRKAFIGAIDSYLDLSFAGMSGPLQVTWWFSKRGVAETVANTIAPALAQFWLEQGPDLISMDETGRMDGYAQGRWEPAGDHDQRGWLPPDLEAVEALTGRRFAGQPWSTLGDEYSP